MAYAKIGFKDRVDNKPDSYLVNGTETTVVKNDSGLISKGTNLNKATFEHIENGIYQNSIDISNVNNTVTNNKGEFDTFKTETTSQLSEIANKAGKVGTKEVDESNIKDNYTLRYDEEKNKIVYVENKIDRIPPNPVTNIKAKEDNTKVIITYTTPSDNDYMGTRLAYKTGSYPTGIKDGTIIGNYISGTEITGLLNDTTYYFRLFSYDTSNNYNTDTSQQITATPTEQKIYGIEIDESNSNPNTRVTYTDDAVGFTPASGNDGNFQWGSWENIVKEEFQIKPCVLNNPTMDVNYYLDYNNYTKKATGEPSVLTGTDGDVMTEFGIPIYYKWVIVGSTQKIQVSIKHFEGAVKYAFEVEQGYNQFPYYPLLIAQIFNPLLFKSTNSQDALGRGYVDDNTNYASTGGTNTKGFMYGETTGKQQIKFLGIEDYWGNKYQWIDGLVTDSSYNLLIGNKSFNDNGSEYIKYLSGISSSTNGYIDKVQGGSEKGFIIKSSGGSETTHYADGGYLSSSCVARFGGVPSVGSTAGFAYLQLGYSASNASASVGSRLFCANNNKIYIGAYLGTEQNGKLRSISGTTPSDNKTIGQFRALAKANNV